MQKVLIDSSTWVSYLAIDSNSKKAAKLFSVLLRRLKLKPTFHLVKMNKKIYRKATKLAKKVQLKTLDLLILTTALHLKVDRLYTFDKKLQKAYKFIKKI